MRPADRRVLMAAGMGAGIAAIFRAPLAGALFASEVLYWSPEFEPEVIIPAGLASVVSYCTFGLYSGWQPLFKIPELDFTNPWQLGPYVLLALWVVILAMLYTRTFYGCTHLFHRWKIPPHFKPAIGALLTGAVGLVAVLRLSTTAVGVGGAVVRIRQLAGGVYQSRVNERRRSLGHRLGEDPDDEPDDRQRRIGRSLWPVDGHRRLWRRGAGGRAQPLVARLGDQPGEFRGRRHGGLLRRGREDAVLDDCDRQRDDRRLPAAAAGAVGLHVGVHSLRPAVDLLGAGGEPVAFAGSSRELRAGCADRNLCAAIPDKQPACVHSSTQRFTANHSRPAAEVRRTPFCPWWMPTNGCWEWSTSKRSTSPPSPSLSSHSC